MIPILQKDYVSEIFGQLEDYLEENMGEAYVENLKEEVTEYNDDTWLAELLILDEYEGCRTKIKNDLKEYPVLRSRISQVSSIFKTKNRH